VGVKGTVTEMRPTVIIVRLDDGEVVLTNTMAQSEPMHMSRISRDTPEV
jgi:hypothetical protein